MASVYSEEYQRVINALKKARKEKGITQAQLAEALGKPQSFIAKVESGERRLGNDSNLLIVFYVQIMPDDFV
ncbi:helix-turn-helix domain-containing protein, partial [Enterobacter kobei]|uniref:helix-turn-helix domain-containing protein n=1 Tax=Enterobacter kobei TaxID=208224 RepID=UPI00113FFE10